MKRLLSLVMTCILICGLFVSGAYAKKEDSLVSGLYHYVLNEDGTAEITDVDRSITDGNIPSELDGHKVTVIGACAFSLCGKLVKAVIPEGVKCLKYNSFTHCARLETICIPDSLEKIDGQIVWLSPKLKEIELSPDHPVFKVEDNMLIDKQEMTLVCIFEPKEADTFTVPQGIRRIMDYTFDICPYSSIILPDSLTEIGAYAFGGCHNLKSIEIPEGVTHIGSKAFLYCDRLESISLPDSLIVIGSGVFGSCVALKNIMISPDHPAYEMIDHLLVDKRNNEIVTALNTIPAQYEIPKGIKGIRSDAFQGCENLTELIVPEGVTSIGSSVFYGCNNLKKITLPASLESIDSFAFLMDSYLMLTSPDQLVIAAPEGSYAQEYCMEKGYKFEGMKNEK